ncbi:MAG: hypothetical protein GDA38_11545 [Hormoscilla sp. SP12CHS1]|nr:hypothetical protein [Hormoscilla sp. SP12CHS1]
MQVTSPRCLLGSANSAPTCPEGHGWRRAAAIGMLQTPAWERVRAW